MRKKIAYPTIIILLFCIGIQSCSIQNSKKLKSPVDYVNPYMGNISHLLVPAYPTIQLPNSMLRIRPVRQDFTTDFISGLPLIQPNHRGAFAFNLSPYQGAEQDILPVINYSYDQEKVSPYSYSVYLDEMQVNIDFSVSHQSAAYEIQFEKNEPAYLILNSGRGELSWDGKAFSGYETVRGHTRVYLYLVPEVEPARVLSLENGNIKEKTKAIGKNACLVLKYPKEKNRITLRYGVSFISIDQARKNMEREVSGKTMDELKTEGRRIWNEALGKIEVEGGSENDKAVFYTSLYRCYERPVCISEDGKYFSPFDGEIHEDNGRAFYIDDWIWDTYRAAHPLRILLEPEKEQDILNSYVLMAEQSPQLWMPTFPTINGDSHSMNCNHGIATFVDAYRKDLQKYDVEKAYLASKGAINEKTLCPWSGKPAGELDEFYKEYGYFPALKEGEKETVPEVHPREKRQSVAVTLGTSYDEWCLSQLAKELGKTDEADYFLKASFNYRNLFNHETGFFHPKDNEGNFIKPFDYVFSGGSGTRDYYDENNGWIYLWDVQHNISDLINLMGGNNAFVKNLDAMFAEPLGKSKYEFYAQLPDHTGNVGQFSMANEPSLHIPYLYNFAGQPWKTQKRIRSLLHKWFRNDLMGIPGDEDGGGMSSFVVFSSIGFYPVTPGNPEYSVGSPLFEKIKIHLSDGKIFEIEANRASSENKYIQSAQINGKPFNSTRLSHKDVVNGGKLIFEMGPKANKEWGENY